VEINAKVSDLIEKTNLIQEKATMISEEIKAQAKLKFENSLEQFNKMRD
jgi:hypothetical protein